MTSTIGVKKIQYPNGTDILTLDSSGTLAIGGNITSNITTTGTVNTPSINGGQISGRRNMIINGDFQCWQRGTGATSAANNYHPDRFKTNENTDGTWTTEQSTDHPTGAGFSLKSQVTGADTSIGSGQYAYLHQNIEAQNVKRLSYGTSSAKDFTLSFWVKSNKTGTYCIVVRKFDNTTYHLVHEYTISSADTWEKKTITITPTAGSTSFITAAAGAHDQDTGTGFQIGWILSMGSNLNGGTNNTWTATTSHYATTSQVNWMDNTSNNFYLAQVQLEEGSQATPFEHRTFGEELSLCQRYFHKQGGTAYYNIAVCVNYTSGAMLGTVRHPVEMRAAPSVTKSGNWGLLGGDTTVNQTAVSSDSNGQASEIGFSGGSGGTSGRSATLRFNNDANAYLHWDAEL